MPKVAIITDTHFGARNSNSYLLDYFQKFYDNVFFPYLDKNGIKTVWHLGDVFDQRKSINFLTLSRAKQMFFDPIVSRGIDLNILLGNHDLFFRSTTDVNSPVLLLQDYGFRIYDSPEVVNVGGVDVLMLPWITPDKEAAAAEAIKAAKAKLVFGHIEIKGFELLRGHISEHGFEQSVFDSYLSVFSGHFHHKSMSNGIAYLGSPYEMTWNDYNSPKGFHILDTDNLTLEFVENPYKMFQRIVYDDVGATPPKIDASAVEGAYVKVVIRNKADPVLFEQMITDLNASKVNSVIITDEHVFSNDRATVEGEDPSEPTEDTLTMMINYIDKLDIPSKEPLSALIRELYIEANELEI